MAKKWKLKREFAEKWIEKLTNGEYEQADSVLFNNNTNKYCCLGVALTNVYDKDVFEDFVASDYTTYTVPKDLLDSLDGGDEYPIELYEWNSTNLGNILAVMNDGITENKKIDLKEKIPRIIFNDAECFDEDKEISKYNFKEIAEFIKLNVEFV